MYFAVLREHGVAHVFNSWTRMPPIGDQLDLPGSVSGPFIVARALLRPGRTYDEAVDAFAPYDRIQDPSPPLRRDLAAPDRDRGPHPDPRLPAGQQPGRRQRAADHRRGAPHAAAGGRLTMEDRASLRRYAIISILAALATIALKGGAYAHHRLGRPALRRARVAGQPRGGHRGAHRPLGRRPAGGRGPPLRPQQGRVLLQRLRGRAHPARGGEHRLHLGRPPARPPADRAASALGAGISVAASLINLLRRPDAVPGGPPAPVHHARGRRPSPDERRLDLGRRHRRREPPRR